MYHSTAQDTQCTERFMELSLLTHRAGQIPGGQILITYLDNEIRLLPDITFTCPTVITSLALGIDVRRETINCNQYPSVLLMQATYYQDYEDDDIYEHLLTEQTIYYTPDNVSTNGVYNYPLDPPISVNVGDILGIRAPNDGASAVRIYYMLIDGLGYKTYAFTFKQRGENWGIISEHLILVYPTAGKLCILVFCC